MASFLLTGVLGIGPVHLLCDPVVAVVVVLLPPFLASFHTLVVGAGAV